MALWVWCAACFVVGFVLGAGVMAAVVMAGGLCGVTDDDFCVTPEQRRADLLPEDCT